VEERRRSYNTKVQIGELEALVRRLADPSGPEM